MNELLTVMSAEMSINRFHDEPDDSFIYRLCYSALGQWCLHTAQNSPDSIVGTTKHNQTIILNDCEFFPAVSDRLIDTSNHQLNLAVHIRRVYEETGYLLTDANNRNRLANFGRSIQLCGTSLFFGIPSTVYTVNGLGVFASSTKYLISAREFLIRDNLSQEEFLQSQFDVIDFYDRDLNLDELEFFNPCSNKAPSQSWEKRMKTDRSVARKSEFGPYYRVIRIKDDSFLFADEPTEPQSDNFTSYEYRRLYFALKANYNEPLRANVIELDAEYSLVTVGGRLPNREYYYLLLLSWPVKNAFDKISFLLRNNFVLDVTAALTNIGIEVKEGYSNA